MKTQQLLTAARFVSSFGHLICLLLLFSTYKVNVEVGLSDQASEIDRQAAKSEALSALVIGVIAMAVDFASIIFANSLFNNKVGPVDLSMYVCMFVCMYICLYMHYLIYSIYSIYLFYLSYLSR